jgi:hypothetical protein
VHQSGADLSSLHPSFFLHMRTNLIMQATSNISSIIDRIE